MNKKFSDTLTNLIVVKRSGQRVNFNGNKIAIAIKQAFDNVFGDIDEVEVNKVYENVLEFINKNYKDRKTINVEDIQDIIEQELNQEKYLNVYNHFKSYRQKRFFTHVFMAEYYIYMHTLTPLTYLPKLKPSPFFVLICSPASFFLRLYPFVFPSSHPRASYRTPESA